MTERSPNAYLLSLTLHGAAAALLLFLAYGMVTQPQAPKIFELVAGAGDNYAATAAPALGSPTGIKIRIPMPESVPAPEPVEPAPVAEPAPLQEAPAPVPVPAPVSKPAPKPSTSTASKAPAKVPDFKRLMERTANRKAARLERIYRRKLEAEERRQMTLDEFRREHPQSSTSASKAPPVEGQGIAGGVVGGSTENKAGGAGGRALTREEGDLFDAYAALLLARLKENLQIPPDVGNKLSAEVEFFLAADGSMSHVRILRTSGSGDFDQAVIDAFHRTHSIGPRPDHRSEDVTLEVGTLDDDSN
jgi:outer membrane biosynthesis protein TonB